MPTAMCSVLPPHQPAADLDTVSDADVDDEAVVQPRGPNTKLTVQKFAAYRMHLRQDAPCGNRLFKLDKLFQVDVCSVACALALA